MVADLNELVDRLYANPEEKRRYASKGKGETQKEAAAFDIEVDRLGSPGIGSQCGNCNFGTASKVAGFSVVWE